MSKSFAAALASTSKRRYRNRTPGASRLFFLIVCAQIQTASVVRAQTPSEFFSGKTIRIINWSEAGGEYDLHGRLIAKYLGQFIPGAPNVVQQNMPGGGGITAANYLYNAAPRDGATLAVVNNSLPLFQALGGDTVRYDAAKLNWIGAISQIVDLLTVWHSAPVKSFHDLLTSEMIMGTTGKGNTSYMTPVAMNALLGTKIKVLIGYAGGGDVNLAIERGEIMGRLNTWSGMKATKPEWIADNKINILVQSGLDSMRELKGVPLLVDLAKNEDDRAIFRIFGATGALSRPLVAPPDVPGDRLAALDTAFAAMVRDPRFNADADKLQIDVRPIYQPRMRELADGILQTAKPLIDRLKRIIE